MTPWPRNPIIYEINAWVWLHELSQRYHRSITLAIVPPEEWDGIAEVGVDAIWLMGVWERTEYFATRSGFPLVLRVWIWFWN